MVGEVSGEIAALAQRMRRDSEHWFPKWHDGTLPLPIAYALGLAGEVGEVANEVKKMHRDGRSNGEGLGPELADVFTYLLLLADDLDIDLVREYEEKRLVNLGRWGSPDGNHTWDSVPIGYDVAGSGVVIDKQRHASGWHVRFRRGPGFLEGEEWTRFVSGDDLVPVGIGRRGLAYPPRRLVREAALSGSSEAPR